MMSTPLTLLLVVLGQHVERFSFFAVLLGDVPPLAPEESFYHRVLSGHADEAIEEAYVLLKERPLVEYYDEIAVPALRLLQDDLNERLLEPDKLAKLSDTIDEIVEVVEEHDEAASQQPGTEDDGVSEPDANEFGPEWRGEAPILCVAGRSPFDHSVAAMFKQLLGREGIGMRVADVGLTAPRRIVDLNTDGVALVCLSYLAVERSPSQARFVIRRLRRRLPGIKVLAGFWAAQEGTEPEANLRLKADSGADFVATTLAEALAVCLREAVPEPLAADAKAKPARGAAE
jgi:hypothetical protein